MLHAHDTPRQRPARAKEFGSGLEWLEKGPLDVRGFEAALRQKFLTSFAQRSLVSGCSGQVGEKLSQRAGEPRDVGQAQRKGPRRRRLLIRDRLGKRRNADGVASGIGFAEPVLGLEKLRVIFLVERILVLLFVLGFDHEVEGSVRPRSSPRVGGG
jgi:hypothetical protein